MTPAQLIFAALIAAVAGALYWAYRHGKLAGALEHAKAELARIEGRVADKVDQTLGHPSVAPVPADAEPKMAIDQLKSQLAALAKRVGA